MKNIKSLLSGTLPHIIAILVFLIISAIYFAPQLSGFLLNQSDQTNYLGMSKEIIDFRSKYDSEPLWTNSMFGGMPAYQISTKHPNIINSFKNYILKIIPRPIGYMFFMMAGFYILLLCFDIKPWVAAIGAVAFGLSSLNILLLETGHNTKVHAISFIPPLIGSIIYAYRKDHFVGGALLSVFLCWHLAANHIQMTYYALFLIVAVLIAEFIVYLKNGQWQKFIKISSILLIAVVLGILPNISNLLVTYEYGAYTIRGKSELTIQNNNASSESKNNALDNDYIKAYNFSKGEVWSVVIPNVKGGEMGYLGSNKEAMANVKPAYRKNIAQQMAYWGEQNATGGSIYFGAGVFLLFVLGVFLVKDNIKWALLAVSLLVMILSWKYSTILDWFIDYMPLFNKFRDTKMMLILAQIAFPLLAFLFIKEVLRNEINKKHFIYVASGVLGLLVLFYIMPSTWFSFFNRAEIHHFKELSANYQNDPSAISGIENIKSELLNARISIFKKDCLRSIFIIILIASLLYLFIVKKIKQTPFLILLGIILLVDIWGVDKRYLNNEKQGSQYKQWVESNAYHNPYQASAADKEILKKEIARNPSLKQKIDNEFAAFKKENKLSSREFAIEKEKIEFRELNFATNYRVFSLLNPFNNSRTSYYHKSIGGYHGAKLKSYQEVISSYITNEYSEIASVLKSQPTNDDIQNLLKNGIPILNMLNTKYIIYNLSAPPITNPYHCGNAWFVHNVKIVENADEEFLSLQSFDKDIAIVQKKYVEQPPKKIATDSTATIRLLSYMPNHLTYETSTASEQFAVFSEIYYKDGWNAYIDGKKVDYYKANYILRAMNIPSGKHTIEFKFEPETYALGRNLSNIGSALVIVFIIMVVFIEYKKRKSQTVAK